jgi:transposase InsO family protein
MAFEGLAEKLQNTFKKLRGKGKINEKDLKEALREVRLALLEADVNYKVVKDFISKIKDRAIGYEVMESLTPGQQVIKIVKEEMTELMGGTQTKIVFSSKPPNTVWVGDITYNWISEGWLYTAIVKDLCTKDVVGYAMDDRMTKELVIKAIKMAIKKEKPKVGLIFHSDRGRQYCSNDFKELLKNNHFRQSMSGRGNPYDNAPAENFFSCLKCECTNFYQFRTRADAKLAIFEYIEVYYNRQRRHGALDWITPLKYKELLFSKLVA